MSEEQKKMIDVLITHSLKLSEMIKDFQYTLYDYAPNEKIQDSHFSS